MSTKKLLGVTAKPVNDLSNEVITQALQQAVRVIKENADLTAKLKDSTHVNKVPSWINTVDYPMLESILKMPRPSRSNYQHLLSTYIDNSHEYVLESTKDYVVMRVGNSAQSNRVGFTCHLDTVDFSDYNGEDKQIILQGDGIVRLSKLSKCNCLGADDGVGFYLMARMINAGIDGTYFFFNDEEIGCLGSKALHSTGNWYGVQSMISFDRKGTDIIKSQRGTVCCSDEFANALALALGRTEKDVTSGVYTDSATFMYDVPECTNIGVGYYSQHTSNETVDLNILDDLETVIMENPTLWSKLPIVRVPKAEVVTPKAKSSWTGYSYDTDLYGDYDYSKYYKSTEDKELTKELRSLSAMQLDEILLYVMNKPHEAAAILSIVSDYTAIHTVARAGGDALDAMQSSYDQMVMDMITMEDLLNDDMGDDDGTEMADGVQETSSRGA